MSSHSSATWALGCLFACTAPAAPAAGTALLPPGHAWEYTFTDPTADPSWNTTTGIGGLWSVGRAPFGNNTGGYVSDPQGHFDFATLWPSTNTTLDDDLWVRTTLDVSATDLPKLHWGLGVDNGFKLYANGQLVAADNAEGYTHRWEYTGSFGEWLKPGSNVLAVALEDHGVLTAFDMTVVVGPVPEPGTGVLFGLGLIVLIGARARSRLDAVKSHLAGVVPG